MITANKFFTLMPVLFALAFMGSCHDLRAQHLHGASGSHQQQHVQINLNGHIFLQTNRVRQQHGLAPLQMDLVLVKTANQFASFMANSGKYGHQVDGRTPLQRLIANGFSSSRGWGENIDMLYESQYRGKVRSADRRDHRQPLDAVTFASSGNPESEVHAPRCGSSGRPQHPERRTAGCGRLRRADVCHPVKSDQGNDLRCALGMGVQPPRLFAAFAKFNDLHFRAMENSENGRPIYTGKHPAIECFGLRRGFRGSLRRMV